MELSDAGLMEIAAHEGIVPYPYYDSKGVITFGIGHTSAAGEPNPARMPKGVESPLAYVLEVFRRDVARYAQDVRQAVKVDLHQYEFDALVSFHFNTGAIRKATITKLLNKGDKAGAAKAFDNWHKPPEIKERRNKERDLFRFGRYSSQGLATVYPADADGKVQWSKGKRVDLTKALIRPAVPDMTDPPFLPPSELEGPVLFPVTVQTIDGPIVITPTKPVAPIHDGFGAEAPWAEKPASGLPWGRVAMWGAAILAALLAGIALWPE